MREPPRCVGPVPTFVHTRPISNESAILAPSTHFSESGSFVAEKHQIVSAERGLVLGKHKSHATTACSTMLFLTCPLSQGPRDDVLEFAMTRPLESAHFHLDDDGYDE